MFTTLHSQIETTSGMQLLDILVVAVSKSHQTVSAYLKVRTFCFREVDESARCVIKEIGEVFSKLINKKLMFNQSFETGGRTVFKVGGGFEIVPGESGADLRQ